VSVTAQRLTVTEWLERYRTAWEHADDGAWVEELFTENASYRSSPFREPHLGHDAIRAYWRRATRAQGDVRVAIGRPVVDGDHVVAEWWTTLRDEEHEYTLPGALILRFADDGRVRDLREYWQVEPGTHAPPDGWGR
jgi:ketosteroid isomerase-like protein